MEKDILSMTLEELIEAVLEIGEKKFRAAQIFEWLNKKNVSSFEEMTNLPKELRFRLSQIFTIVSAKMLKKIISSDDNTQKYLFVLPKNTIIESVLMNYEYGDTACISSQAGCKMGCAFCASAKGGFQRNLTAGEMLAQMYSIEKHAGVRIGRVVLMGTGEPFDNFENVMRFITLINHNDGHGMGMRNITVSTCGLVPKINEFAEKKLQVNLAVSLHAPNGSIRERLMPVEKKYPFDLLIKACENYTKKTGRRVTFEYALIDGQNDEAAHAKQLASRLSGLLCHVNLIPANEVEGTGVKTSKKAGEFLQTLQNAGINATLRRKLGADIGGACGQLRSDYL